MSRGPRDFGGPEGFERFRRFDGFEGTAEALALVAAEAAAEFGLADDPVEPNARLVRDYLRRGIVQRPERRGREAIFGPLHLLQFLAARLLVSEGWPLAKIADYTGTAGREELRGLLERPRVANPAVAAVNALLREREPVRAPSPRSGDVPGWQLDLLQRRREGAELLRAIGNPTGEPDHRSCVVFDLAPGVWLGVERGRLEAMTRDEAETLGRAISSCLWGYVWRKSP